MPNINPKEAGDNFYPRYNVVTTEPVDASVDVAKGFLYTKNSSGNLVKASETTDWFLRGCYQATRGFTASSTAGADTVQCFGPGSRIGIEAAGALVRGDRVMVHATNGKAIAFAEKTAGTFTFEDLNRTFGRVYRIYSRTDFETEKDVAADGDIVVVVLE